jgi:apolipoprotein N-acyltransferase
VLINVTNDGWFGNTTGPQQHFHQARVLAVEEGLPIIRAANNGISAIVDPNGRVLKHLGLNERGVIDSGLPASRPRTVYSRFGDALFACGALVLAALALALARRQSRQ